MATIQATKQTSPVNVEHRKNLDIRPGDTVRVWTKVVEKGKTRLQPFEGMVLARKHGSEAGATFTVRKVSSGVGIERIFPLYSPNIEKIELVKRAKTRRSKLYYIREKAAKQIRRKMKAVTLDVPDLTAGEEMPPEEETKQETQTEEVTQETQPEQSEETASQSSDDTPQEPEEQKEGGEEKVQTEEAVQEEGGEDKDGAEEEKEK